MMYVECGYCGFATRMDEISEHRLCEVCAKAFEILEIEEIEAIAEQTGFKRQAPHKEFLQGAE